MLRAPPRRVPNQPSIVFSSRVPAAMPSTHNKDVEDVHGLDDLDVATDLSDRGLSLKNQVGTTGVSRIVFREISYIFMVGIMLLDNPGDHVHEDMTLGKGIRIVGAVIMAIQCSERERRPLSYLAMVGQPI